MSAIIAAETVTLTIPGVLSSSSIVSAAMPFNGQITGAYVAVTTAPTGSALTADLKVGSNVAVAFSIPASATSDEGTVNASYAKFTKGAIVSLDVASVGGSTAGSNITVAFTVERLSPATHIADASYND